MSRTRQTLTLVGRAHEIAFHNGLASWKIAIKRSNCPDELADFILEASQQHVLEQFEQMDEGQLIGVIAELPPVRKRQPGVPLVVTRLELLGKKPAAVGAR